MKRFYVLALVIILALFLVACGNGDGLPQENTSSADSYVNRYPGEYNTSLVNYSEIQIKDKDGNDISHIAIDLWYAANEIYNVDDYEMFDIGEQEVFIDPRYFNELKNYSAVVESVFTQNGITQLEQTVIDGANTTLIRKRDDKIFRMGAWKTGYSYAWTLTDMEVKEYAGSNIILAVTYAIVDFDGNIHDNITVDFTIANVGGKWLVDGYVYPEACHSTHDSS